MAVTLATVVGFKRLSGMVMVRRVKIFQFLKVLMMFPKELALASGGRVTAFTHYIHLNVEAFCKKVGGRMLM